MPTTYKRYCNYCNTYYEGFGKFYCSCKCASTASAKKRKTGKIVLCKFCGKKVYKSRWYLKKAKNFFCSRRCFGKKGRSEETKRKISENNARYLLGKKRDPRIVEKIRKSLTGRKMTEEQIEKMRIAYRRLHPEYNENKYREKRSCLFCNKWRRAVFKRDNYICQKCNERSGELQAHHVQNFEDYKKLRSVVSNGITLCKKCHVDFHREYGFKRSNKVQLEKFLL